MRLPIRPIRPCPGGKTSGKLPRAGGCCGYLPRWPVSFAWQGFWQKFDLISTLSYWLSFIGQMIYILAPILSALFNIRFVDAPVWQILGFWLPHYVLYYVAVKTFSGHTRTNHWSAVVDTIMAPYLCIPTILEIMGIRQKKFIVTNKGKGEDVQEWRKILYVIPHTLLLIATVFSFFILMQRSIAIKSLYNPIVLFWLGAGAKNLIFSIFFMLGRVNYRSFERFYGNLPMGVACFGQRYSGHTVDFSDTGLAAVFDVPLNCRSDAIVDVLVKTEHYAAHMKCRVVNVKQQPDNEEGQWKYGFVIEAMSEENRRQYLQILYDRAHSLPKRFKNNASVFDDINTNLMLRTRRKEFNVRKMPRLTVELPFLTEEGISGMLHDFNFEFARIDMDEILRPNETLTLHYGEGLTLVVMPNIAGEGGSVLYRIVNADAILTHPDYHDIMGRWTGLQNLPDGQKPLGTGTITTPEDKLPQGGVAR